MHLLTLADGLPAEAVVKPELWTASLVVTLATQRNFTSANTIGSPLTRRVILATYHLIVAGLDTLFGGARQLPVRWLLVGVGLKEFFTVTSQAWIARVVGHNTLAWVGVFFEYLPGRDHYNCREGADPLLRGVSTLQFAVFCGDNDVVVRIVRIPFLGVREHIPLAVITGDATADQPGVFLDCALQPRCATRSQQRQC